MVLVVTPVWDRVRQACFNSACICSFTFCIPATVRCHEGMDFVSLRLSEGHIVGSEKHLTLHAETNFNS